MKTILFYTLIFFSLLTLSCNSSRKMTTSRVSTAQLSQKLGFKVTRKDDLKLYSEAVKWLGVPYKYGGNTKTGVDCSGLTCNIYRNAYNIKLERTVAGMYKKNCRKIGRAKLRPGDLVFFNTAKTHKSVSHVGIFLKNNIFIHSTTHSGVRLNTLDETYYKKKWINGGKVRNFR